MLEICAGQITAAEIGTAQLLVLEVDSGEIAPSEIAPIEGQISKINLLAHRGAPFQKDIGCNLYIKSIEVRENKTADSGLSQFLPEY